MLMRCGSIGPATDYVMTVQGEVPASRLGRVLVHEHITTDFIGAEQVEQPQYELQFAVQTILPHLRQLQQQGVNTLVECTPNHIGRDVRLLRALADSTGLHIMTNTGYYAAVDKKFLPQYVYKVSAEELARTWEREWISGIDGTGIRPGFIKLGVGQGPLDEIEEKLLIAGIMLSKKSGLPLYIHTGDGAAARSEYDIIRREGLPADRMIWVHAQNGTDEERIALARQGVWISLDGVSEPRIDDYVDMLSVLKANGLLSQALISHDDGWSVENREGEIVLQLFGNGNSTPYRTIFDGLLPALRAGGFSEKEIKALLADHPRRALSIKGRKRQ